MLNTINIQGAVHEYARLFMMHEEAVRLDITEDLEFWDSRMLGAEKVLCALFNSKVRAERVRFNFVNVIVYDGENSCTFTERIF